MSGSAFNSWASSACCKSSVMTAMQALAVCDPKVSDLYEAHHGYVQVHAHYQLHLMTHSEEEDDESSVPASLAD